MRFLLKRSRFGDRDAVRKRLPFPSLSTIVPRSSRKARGRSWLWNALADRIGDPAAKSGPANAGPDPMSVRTED